MFSDAESVDSIRNVTNVRLLKVRCKLQRS